MLQTTDYYLEHLAAVHTCSINSEIAQQYLTSTEIRLDGVLLVSDDHIELPSGGSLSIMEFAHLFSVFNGSRVHMQAQKSLSLDDAPPGMYFTIINNKIIKNQHKNKFGIFQANPNSPDLYIEGLHIDHFFLNEHVAPGGLGTVAFGLCAITSHLARIGSISLIAAGGVGFNPKHIGFKVWPRLGFNAMLLPGETNSAPHLSECLTVLDVLAIDINWWDVHGSQRLMTFDLEPDSVSWRKLLNYLTVNVCPGVQDV